MTQPQTVDMSQMIMEEIRKAQEDRDAMRLQVQNMADALGQQNIRITQLVVELDAIKSKSTHSSPPIVTLTPPDTKTSETIQIDSESGTGLGNAMKAMEKSEKLPDPLCFSGKRNDLRRFLQGLDIKFKGNSDRYTTPTSRLYYAWSRLEKDAADWMSTIQPETIEDLVKALEAAYGDPHRETSARHKLIGLRQGNKSFISHYTEFHRYAKETNLGPEALIDYLLMSLSEELKAMTVTLEEYATLEDTATAINNLHIKMIRFATKKAFPARQHVRTRDPDAMDVDAVDQRKRRSSQSRERYLKKGLYFNYSRYSYIVLGTTFTVLEIAESIRSRGTR